jgi:hypothetical protein
MLVMIEHFCKWLKLVPLLHYSSRGAIYAFLDRVFSRFGTLAKILINQDMKICMKFYELCEKCLLIIRLLHETILKQMG